MIILEENILEPVARFFRLRAVRRFFQQGHDVVDFGCGPKAPFYRQMPSQIFRSYIGIDPLTTTHQINDQAVVLQRKIEDTKLPKNSVDRVVMLAVLEHVDDPLQVLREAYRVLKPGGLVVLTTPTPQAQKLLEFLSFRLHLISPREIAEHKRYLKPEETATVLQTAGFREVHAHPFELGWNQVAWGIK